MAEKTKKVYSNSIEVDDRELRSTLEDFLEEEKKQEKSIWNFSTITGLVMLFVVAGVMGQSIAGSLFGISPAIELSGLLNILPVIGGVLVVLAGFGYLTGDKSNKKTKSLSLDSPVNYNYASVSSPSSTYSTKDKLDDFLNIDESGRSKTDSGRSSFKKKELEAYALAQKKKLFKSRTDKKIFGVCGGIAKYFGVSSTIVRIIFAVAFLLGYGSFLLVYIALGIVIPKEPIDLIDRYNFNLDD
ncbi:MAG: PspC domain-containing protein [Balneolaceae bacterium]